MACRFALSSIISICSHRRQLNLKTDSSPNTPSFDLGILSVPSPSLFLISVLLPAVPLPYSATVPPVYDHFLRPSLISWSITLAFFSQRMSSVRLALRSRCCAGFSYSVDCFASPPFPFYLLYLFLNLFYPFL